MIQWLRYWVVVLCVCLSTSVFAEWQYLKNFSAPVKSVHFLNNLGKPEVGFVGLSNGKIWRTADSGKTWFESTVPTTPAAICNFYFKDAQNGWCSVRPSVVQTSCCYRTTDGGLSWSPLNIPGIAVCVYYNPLLQELYLILWSGEAVVSKDQGNTWNTLAPINMNGIDMSGPFGIMGVLRGESVRVTRDGGITWLPSPLQAESWQPVVIPGTTNFFVLGEKTRSIYHSSDAGISWNTVYTFPGSIAPTGQISCSNQALFVQTSSGMYASIDQGKSWRNICGPANNLDTRFHVGDQALYAGDPYGSLWYNPNPLLEQKLSLTNTLQVSAPDCSSKDTTIVLNYEGSCVGNLLGISMQNKSGQSFYLKDKFYNKPLTGSDSLHISYIPADNLSDTAILFLRFSAGDYFVDTTVTLIGNKIGGPDYVMNATSISFPQMNTCSPLPDTAIVFTNTSCKEIKILSVLTDDPSLQLPANRFPMTLKPSDSVHIDLLLKKLLPGLHSSKVKLTIERGGSGLRHDVTLDLDYHVLGEIKSLYASDLSINVKDLCGNFDTVIEVINPFCDSVYVTNLSIKDPKVLTIIPFSGIKLAPLGSIQLPVRFLSKATNVYTLPVALSFWYKNALVDTVLAMKVQIKNDGTVAPLFQTTTVQYDSVSTCSSLDKILHLTNRQCVPFTVKKGIVKGINAEDFVLLTPGVDRQVMPDSSFALSIRYKPLAARSSKANLVLTIESNNIVKDTSISLNGTSFDNLSINSSATVIDFGAVSRCSTPRKSVMLTSQGCTDLMIASASLVQGTVFQLNSIPKLLTGGGTAELNVELQPTKIGKVTDKLLVLLRSSAGVERLLSYDITADVTETATSVSFYPAAIKNNSLKSCEQNDTVIVLKNAGSCDPLRITEVTSSNPNFLQVAASRTLPCILPSGDSLLLFATVTPTSDKEELATVSIKGDNYDSAIQVGGIVEASGKALAVSDQVMFTTTLCQNSQRNVTLTNTGCFDLQLDSLNLSNSGYALTSNINWPVILKAGEERQVPVNYSPSSTDTVEGTLTIFSENGKLNKTVKLLGIAVDTRSVLELSLRRDDVQQMKAGDTTSVAIVMGQPIPGNAGLKTVECILDYNGDFWTSENRIDLADGWKLLNSTYGKKRIVLTLERTNTLDITAGVIARIHLRTILTDTEKTVIRLSNIICNKEDSLFDQCGLIIRTVDPEIDLALDNNCGDESIRKGMRGDLSFTRLRVFPNPAGRTTNSHVTVDIGISQDQPVTFLLQDHLGRAIKKLDYDLTLGNHQLDLDLTALPEGTYVLVAQSPFQTLTRKLSIFH